MLISQSDYGVKVKGTMRDWEVSDLETFAGRFKTRPAKGLKDGSYFLMGNCKGKQRLADAVPEVSLIILDCDDRLDENRKTVKGAPPVEEVLRVLDESEAAYLLYTTFSHIPSTLNRYRIVFFLDSLMPSEKVASITGHMFDSLNEKGVMLAHTPESGRQAQAWYFPRLKEEDSEYICKYNVERHLLDWKSIKIVELPTKSWRESTLSHNKNRSLMSEWGMITIFLETHNNFESINKLLESKEYERKYMTSNGAKYLAPNSTSAKPGLSLFKGDDDKWRVVSYHGEHDLLSKQTSEDGKLCLDALDVFTLIGHEKPKTSDEAIKWLTETHFKRLREYFQKRFVYIIACDKIGDTKRNMIFLKDKAFENYTAPAFAVVTATSGNPKTVQASKDWMSGSYRQVLADRGWRPVADRVLTRDDGDRDKELYWNDYISPGWEEVDTEEYLYIFTDHMKYLIPNQDDRHLTIQWLAERIQYPEDRARFALLHIAADQGTGRSWLAGLMDMVLGFDNTSSTTIKELCGDGSQFNEYLYKKQLCCIHEVASEGKKSRYKIDDKTRSVLIDGRLPIDVKGKFKGSAKIYTSFFMMSNHRNCLEIPEGDRRIFVIEGMEKHKEDAYYEVLKRMIENRQFIREVYSYLKRLDISMLRDMKRPPLNAAKKRLLGTNRSDTETFFREILNPETTPGLIWTRALVQTYIDVRASLVPLGICDAQRVTGEVKKLCKNDLVTAYNGDAVSCLLPTGERKTYRLKAIPDFPEDDLTDTVELQDGLEGTTAAVKKMVREAIAEKMARETQEEGAKDLTVSLTDGQ